MYRTIRRMGINPNHLELQTFRQLAVRGLDSKTTDHILKEYFRQWGPVLEAYVIRNRKGQVRNFGFVIYTHSTMVDEALKVESHMILGKPLSVNHIRPNAKNTTSLLHDNGTRKIYIKPVPDDITESDLVLHFQDYGTISNVIIMKDNHGRHQGSAIIQFEDFDDIRRVLMQKYYRICGTFVEVSLKREFDGGHASSTNETIAATANSREAESEAHDESKEEDISINEVSISPEAALNVPLQSRSATNSGSMSEFLAQNRSGCRVEDLETVIGNIFNKIGAGSLWKQMQKGGFPSRLRKYTPNGLPPKKKKKKKSKGKGMGESQGRKRRNRKKAKGKKEKEIKQEK